MGLFSRLFGSSERTMSPEDIKQNNPSMEVFQKLTERDEEVNEDSVLARMKMEDQGGAGFASSSTSAYSDFVYSPVSTNKFARVADYKRMLDSPEVGDAVDEICNAFVNYDENGRVVNLKFPTEKLNDNQRNELRKEFDYVMSLFNPEMSLYDDSKKYVSEGQVTYENVISSSDPEDGITSVVLVENEEYEFLIDPNTLEKTGIFKYNDSSYDTFEQFQKGMDKNVNPNEMGSSNVYNQDKGTPMLWRQLTYIDTGEYSTNKMVVFPVLERARKAHRQLSLIEDAIIIYRLARAPERLIFNIDTGRLSKARAEQEVYNMAKRYQSKKYYNQVTGSISNDYDPHQLQENFFFPKPEGSGGTSVTQLKGGSNLGEIKDLEYFQEKLWTSLKVPFTRKNESKTVYNKDGKPSYEEKKFADFIVKHQRRFAMGYTSTLKTHLELLGLWDDFGLTDSDMLIELTPPLSYKLYEQQRILELKFSLYDVATKDRSEMSKEFAMRKYLGLSEAEILSNRELRTEERKREAYIQFLEAKITAKGTLYDVKTESDDNEEL